MHNLVGPQIQQALRENRPMGREEELAVAHKARLGDKRARDRLVLCNLGIAISWANKYTASRIQFDDLVQYATMGLVRALAKFNPTRGLRFSTYAAGWIRATLQEAVVVREPLIRGSRNPARGKAGSRENTNRAAPQVLPLNVPLGDEGDMTFLDALASDAEPADVAIHRMTRDSTARDRVDRLFPDARMRDVVRARLMADPPETLHVVGARWGVSRERIRQLELRARETLERNLFDLAA